ncbi:MAG: DUF4430 domain-containing protein [Clostridia bacterium]|nr:DUF4430 domain-containing protein [Clostridia bacterium]
MKNTSKIVIFAMALAVLCAVFVSQGNITDSNDLWGSAVYTDDTEFGNGEKTVIVKVVAGDNSVDFVLNTDQETLGEALLENKLISGEKGPYGLYVKTVNGILADYDENKSYWSLSKNGEYMQTGVSDTKIADGENYELTYTK